MGWSEGMVEGRPVMYPYDVLWLSAVRSLLIGELRHAYCKRRVWIQWLMSQGGNCSLDAPSAVP
jgi:hypothetical protein